MFLLLQKEKGGEVLSEKQRKRQAFYGFISHN